MANIQWEIIYYYLPHQHVQLLVLSFTHTQQMLDEIGRFSLPLSPGYIPFYYFIPH
jgi:hypothetical protein